MILSQEPEVVQGCGISENEIAKEIRKKISHSKMKHSTLEYKAICAVAEALEEISQPVLNGDLKSFILSKEAQEVENPRKKRTPNKHVSDLLGAKKSALTYAIGAASTLLRISNVIIET